MLHLIKFTPINNNTTLDQVNTYKQYYYNCSNKYV